MGSAAARCTHLSTSTTFHHLLPLTSWLNWHGLPWCCRAGSRSSPLALAAATHPRARLNICIDERSLGFWAVGYGRSSSTPAAVITSSGTAVANLLPAAVEASLSHVPLLLLTADRPVELRDTGANQTIDQVG